MRKKARFIPWGTIPAYFETHDSGVRTDPYVLKQHAENGTHANIGASELARALLARSDEHLATSSLLLHEALHAREEGVFGWSHVAFYYAGFHAARGLLALTGQAIFRMKPPSIAKMREFAIGVSRAPSPQEMQVKAEPTQTRSRQHASTWLFFQSMLERNKPPFLKNISPHIQPDSPSETEDRNSVNYDPDRFLDLTKAGLGHENLERPVTDHRFRSHPFNPHVERRGAARLALLVHHRERVAVDFRPNDEDVVEPNEIQAGIEALAAIGMCSHAPLVSMATRF